MGHARTLLWPHKQHTPPRYFIPHKLLTGSRAFSPFPKSIIVFFSFSFLPSPISSTTISPTHIYTHTYIVYSDYIQSHFCNYNPQLLQHTTILHAGALPGRTYRSAVEHIAPFAALSCAPYCITPYYTAPYCTTPHCTALHRTAPHCTALHHTAPHCTTLHHTTPH